MMKLNKEKIIAITILAVLTIFLYSLFLAPQRKRLKAVRSQYVSAKELLETRGIKGGKIDVLRSENQEWRNKLDSIEDRFIIRDEVNQFLKGLTRVAKRTGNDLKTVDPLERTPKPEFGIERTLVEVSIIGNYSSIIDFLNELVHDKKLLKITDLEIEKEKEESRDLKVSFILTLYVIEGRTW
ncbi:MAG: type 4a pilus biogenesis protein PilO [Candidatus Omnitrophota bacterium]